jgi:tetratricopeptide (TPR) repeat protein
LAGLDYISSNWTGYRSDVRVLRAESPNALYTLRALRDYYATMGFPEQAIIFGYRALKADAPDNDYRGGKVANLLSYEGRFRESIGLTRAILARQPNYAPGLGLLCRNYAFTGRATEALEIKKNLLFGGLNTDLALCDWGIDMAKHDRAAALRLLQTWQSGFPDGAVRLGANDIGWGYLILGDFDKATDWFERAYERHEPDLYRDFYTGLGVWDAAQPVHSYRLTPAYKALAAKPLFKAWQAEHDRIAAELAARGGAP